MVFLCLPMHLQLLILLHETPTFRKAGLDYGHGQGHWCRLFSYNVPLKVLKVSCYRAYKQALHCNCYASMIYIHNRTWCMNRPGKLGTGCQDKNNLNSKYFHLKHNEFVLETLKYETHNHTLCHNQKHFLRSKRIFSEQSKESCIE